MNRSDFLLEIGCEELPAKRLLPLVQSLAHCVQQELDDAGLHYGEVKTFATPRRLAVLVSQLDARQPSREDERQGPSIQAAYDKQGAPTLACIGFARSCGVMVDQLQVKETPKGKRVYVNLLQSGLPATELLPQLVEQALKKMPLPKLMRWGDTAAAFVRPVHWVLMLCGEQRVPATILGQQTTCTTQGHRFHHPQTLIIPQAGQYERLLQTQAYVVADFALRKQKISEQIAKLAGDYRAIVDEDLLNEVTGLVEWPVAYQGKFNPDFLQVPREVLITSMQTHQKCFALENAAGELQPSFIIISNIDSQQPEQVIAGNQRVINARLADAAFFYKKDCQYRLEHYLEVLNRVTFQRQLGSMGDRAKRIAKLTEIMAKKIGANVTVAKRAGLLAKCDLLTEMVGEFPGLQGTMGYYYALNDQESEACAQAIGEQYQPRFAGDILPQSLLGCALSLACRVDTVAGILGIEQFPTGDKDPFALRRAALGLLRILIEKKLSLDVRWLLEQAQQAYQVELPNKQLIEGAYNFIMQRLKAWYTEKGVSPQTIDAVMACQPQHPLDFDARVSAVEQFCQLPEAAALIAANKRVSNILRKQASDFIASKINLQLLDSDVEKQLIDSLSNQQKVVKVLYQQSDYAAALASLAELKQPVDRFFDQVMIMVDEPKLRSNRLNILATLHGLFTQVADISLLAK